MMTSTIACTAKANPSPYQFDRGSSNKTKTLPLPPYGKEAAFLLSFGVRPRNDVFLFAGLNGWRKAKAFENTQVVLCLPYNKDPTSYSWPVKDCPVLLIDTGFLNITDIEKIAYCLLCANAFIVRAILSSNKLVIYKRNAHEQFSG